MTPRPDGDPAAPPGEPDEGERERRLRRLSRRLQAGGAVFLAIALLGLVPGAISSVFPAFGERAAVAVWLVAPALGVGLLAVAALRLRR